jgi:hypothetical protein
MSTEEVKVIHTEGPAWETVGRFPTFDVADKKRNELLEEENLQVKVHWQGPPHNRFFAVKSRLDPASAAEEEAIQRRAEKKRRKLKLSKKRRKK